MTGILTGMLLTGSTGGGGGGGGGGGTLKVVINAGLSIGGPTGSHSFPLNTFTATLGTAPYVGTWSNTNDGFGTWNGPTVGATFTPHVGGMAPGDVSVAVYVCSVVDAVGATGISNIAVYSWTDTSTA
jgi:hypothetical protein